MQCPQLWGVAGAGSSVDSRQLRGLRLALEKNVEILAGQGYRCACRVRAAGTLSSKAAPVLLLTHKEKVTTQGVPFGAGAQGVCACVAEVLVSRVWPCVDQCYWRPGHGTLVGTAGSSM